MVTQNLCFASAFPKISKHFYTEKIIESGHSVALIVDVMELRSPFFLSFFLSFILSFFVSFQSQSGKLQPKLDQAVKRLATLEEQLDGVKTGKVRSPGLVVMGGDSCSKGHGFESQYLILDVHFFTFN